MPVKPWKTTKGPELTYDIVGDLQHRMWQEITSFGQLTAVNGDSEPRIQVMLEQQQH